MAQVATVQMSEPQFGFHETKTPPKFVYTLQNIEPTRWHKVLQYIEKNYTSSEQAQFVNNIDLLVVVVNEALFGSKKKTNSKTLYKVGTVVEVFWNNNWTEATVQTFENEQYTVTLNNFPNAGLYYFAENNIRPVKVDKQINKSVPVKQNLNQTISRNNNQPINNPNNQILVQVPNHLLQQQYLLQQPMQFYPQLNVQPQLVTHNGQQFIVFPNLVQQNTYPTQFYNPGATFPQLAPQQFQGYTPF